VRTAFEGVQQAHSAYEYALAIASDTDLDREGFLALTNRVVHTLQP